MKRTDNLIVLPEHAELRREVERLRAEIPMLILERDHLRYVECRNLETSYMLSVGALEHKAYKAQCMMLRLKRKVELIQACINRQEKIDLSRINRILDDEFAAYQEEINAQIERMNEAIQHSRGEYLTKEQAKEARKLYCAIVKSLHPDLHPNVTENELDLLRNAMEAYKNGDLDTLQIIYTMRSDLPLPNTDEDLTTALYRERERLKKIIGTIQEEIASIKAEFPYTMKEFLSDRAKVKAKKQELEELINSFWEMERIYQAKIDELLPGRQGR